MCKTQWILSGFARWSAVSCPPLSRCRSPKTLARQGRERFAVQYPYAHYTRMHIYINTRMHDVLPFIYSSMNTRRMTNDAKMIGDALNASMMAFDRGRGISQAELSRRTGVPQPTISRTLKGKTVPEFETLTKLVAVLGTDGLARAVSALLPNQGGAEKIVRLPKRYDADTEEVVRMMEATDQRGRILALGAVKEALRHHRPAKAKQR